MSRRPAESSHAGGAASSPAPPSRNSRKGRGLAVLRSHEQGRLDSIAAFSLCFVQCCVCCQKKALGHPHGSTKAGKCSSNADARCDRSSSLRLARSELEALNRGPHLFGYFDSTGSVCGRKNDGDFLSAVASGYVCGAHSLADRNGDGAQAIIADLMSVLSLNDLK